MKILFEKHLCPREFGSAVFNVPALLTWAQEKGFHLATVPPLDGYDFAQAEYVLSSIENFSRRYSTEDEAAAVAAINPTLAQNRAAEIIPLWLVGAEAARQWRGIFSQAIANGELVLFDRYSLLPVVTAAAPAAKGKAGASPSGDDKPWLIAAPNDPAPDYPWYTPARYFARQLVKDNSTLLVKKEKLAEKTAASLASAGVFKRGKKKLPLSAGTVLKSFVNVTLS